MTHIITMRVTYQIMTASALIDSLTMVIYIHDKNNTHYDTTIISFMVVMIAIPIPIAIIIMIDNTHIFDLLQIAYS